MTGPNTASPGRSLNRLQRAKNHVLPRGLKIRRLPLGPGHGIRLELDFEHHTRLYFGLYERELNQHLKAFARSSRVSFDVGAQLGYDALVLAKLSGGHVVSFECDPTAVAGIRRSLSANPSLEGRVRVVDAYIGDTTAAHDRRLTLDDASYAPDGLIPDLVKIDIEGDELKALRGAGRLIRERRPHLIVETHTAELETACLGLLRVAGYDPQIVHQRRWMPDNRPIAHNRWIVAEGERTQR